VLAALAAAAPGAAAQDDPPRPAATSWVLIDGDDGDVLADRASHRELPMASTTKLMTALLAREELDLDEVVTAAPYQPGPAESLMGLRDGEQVSVEDLLYGLLLASGNDAAVTLAVAAAGSERAFVAQMNREARRLGLEETSYENPIGFDGPGHYTTASDLVDLAVNVREDPVLREIVDTPEIRLTEGERTRTIENRNTLVRELPFVNGVKTGYTEGAGYVLVGSGSGKGATVVSALIGAPSEAARDAGTLALLRYGLSLYRREAVVERGERLDEVGIVDRDVTVPLEASESATLSVRRDEDVEVEATGVPLEIEGPIAAGDQLGAAVVTVDGEREARVKLVAARSADAASLIETIDASLPGSRAGAWGLLALGALAIVLVVVVPVVWLVRRRSDP
jgi:D-alanyl-D-alanine carboxypeptidase (penicillin-binding protein 5/6)